MNEQYMKAAIAQALKGKDFVYPNPLVGCVIVKDAKIIAQGFHQYFGAMHAEAAAIAQAGEKAKGADLYVTLEPCNEYGKRPPCAAAIVKAGIKRVFFAIKDPTVSGAQNFLRKNGVEVFGGLCAKEARALIKDFLAHIKTKPKITIKAAMTLDGKIATAAYDSKWISSESSRDLVHKMRSRYDAVLIGSNTAVKDNPFLTSHDKGRNPIRAAVDLGLKIPEAHHLLDDSVPTIILHDEKIKNIPKHFLKEKIILAPINAAARRDFKIIKDKLISIGIKTVLIEGGGEMIASALFSGCADDIALFISPKIIGGRNSISVVGGDGVLAIKDAAEIKNMKVKKIGGDLLITGEIKNRQKR